MDTTYSDLTFRDLDARAAPLVAGPLVTGWQQAVARGFHQGRFDEAMLERALGHWNSDAAVLRGAWAAPALGHGDVPVATFASWDKDLNVGGGVRLPVRMITDITVSPTHRRRGLLRRLMTEGLHDAATQGLPLAALTVSEGAIYDRFGFGLATSVHRVEIDVTRRFAIRQDADLAPGQLVLLPPGPEAAAAMDAVFERFHHTTRGSIARPSYYRDFSEKGLDDEGRSADPKRHICVLVDDEGPCGYVAYRHVGRPDHQDRRPTVQASVVATSPAVYLRLWRFLADLDLVDRVVCDRAPLDDPLAWALVDPFCVRVVGVSDLLWVRVLDVVTALEARPWAADDTVVLEIADPLGHASGRFRVSTRDGHAEVAPTEEAPEVDTDAGSLGACYLGGVSVRTLVAAGRVRGTAEAVDRFARMADAGPLPYCPTAF